MIDINALSDAEKVQLARDLEDAKARDAARAQAEQNAAVQQRRVAGRLARLEVRLGELEPWEGILLEEKLSVETEKAAVMAARAPESDRWRYDAEQRRLAVLEDTLLEIHRGVSNKTSGDLRERIAARNLKPLPGRVHPLEDRYGLKRTQDEIGELRRELEELRAQLAG